MSDDAIAGEGFLRFPDGFDEDFALPVHARLERFWRGFHRSGLPLVNESQRPAAEHDVAVPQKSTLDREARTPKGEVERLLAADQRRDEQVNNFNKTSLFQQEEVIRSAQALTYTEQRIGALEQENQSLKQQIATLKQENNRVEQALAAAQTKVQALEQAQSVVSETPPEVAAPATVSQPQAASTSPQPQSYTLKLDNVRIVGSESENVFKIGFSVLRDGVSGERVTGTIWIAVNGFSNRKPKSLSFKSLSPDRRLYVKMGFDHQQDVMEQVVLPEGFEPRSILIEAKPYGDKYTGTSGKFDWATSR